MCIFIDSVEECEVQTNLKIWTEPINIEFTEDSLTYMEKLWLKKHRRYVVEFFCLLGNRSYLCFLFVGHGFMKQFCMYITYFYFQF